MATSLLESRQNKWIFAACWLLWAVIHFITLRHFDVDWGISLVDALTSNVLLAGLSASSIHSLAYYRPGGFLYLLAGCFVTSLLWSLVIAYGLGSTFDNNPAYLNFLNQSMLVRFNIALLVVGGTCISGMIWYSFDENKTRESLLADAEKFTRDAELYKLRQQLQPHFIFNSLNSISALAGHDPEQARKMIQQLSDFLRDVLKKEEHQWISLADELQHLQLYLDMEKMRFGHRLSTRIERDEASLSCLIPPMLLQPIVENAIKFGLYDTTEKITISITARKVSGFLVLIVQNPFDPETAAPRQGTGFGLSSVKRRLYLLFARNDLFETKAEDRLFSTTIKIPVNDKDDPDR